MSAQEASEATPAADPGAPKRRWASEGIDQPWSVGEAIGMSMRSLRRSFVSLVVPLLCLRILDLVIGGALGFAAYKGLLNPKVAGGVGAGVGLVSGILSFSLLVETTLHAVRGDKLPPGAFGRAIKRMPRMFGYLLLPLLVSTGPTLLILAGFEFVAQTRSVWELVAILPLLVLGPVSLMFWLTPFFIVDDDTSLVAAARRSWRSSGRFLGSLWLYGVALFPIALLSLFPIFGAIAQVLFWLGLAFAYVRSTGKNDLPWLRPEFSTQSIRRFLGAMLVLLLATFGCLYAAVRSLPATRGASFSIMDAAVRASAILTGVSAVVVLLALLLPYVLDALEGRRFVWYVAARHVRSQKSGFLTIISILSICGVAISSCALSSVVSVMDGFSQDLKRKILGNNAHIVIDTTAGLRFTDYDPTLAKVRAVPGVVGATAVVHGEVMASSASNLAGVIVNGIDPKSIRAVIDLEHNVEVGKVSYLENPSILTHLPANEVVGIGPGGEPYYRGADLPGLPEDVDPAIRSIVVNKPERPGIILGRELAKTLHVYVGDEVTLVSPLGDLGPMGIMPKTKRFRVAAIFYSGMYEYDASYVYTMMGTAQEYFDAANKVSAIEIKVEDADHAEAVAATVEAAIKRPDLRVRSWPEINKNLFSALKLERYATFIILSIAIMVASFCIVCTLLLMVTEKGKEIAILKALGARDGSILRIFILEGIIIGGIGMVFGVVTGLAVCTGLSWFGLRLDPEVYYIDRLPISVNGWNFLSVAVAALFICALSTLYPAYAASRLRPVDGLRYE